MIRRHWFLIAAILRYAVPVAALTAQQEGLYYLLFLSGLELVIMIAVLSFYAMTLDDFYPGALAGALFLQTILLIIGITVMGSFGMTQKELTQFISGRRLEMAVASLGFLIGYILYFREQHLESDDLNPMMAIRAFAMLLLFAAAFLISKYFGNYRLWWSAALLLKLVLDHIVRKIETA